MASEATPRGVPLYGMVLDRPRFHILRRVLTEARNRCASKAEEVIIEDWLAELDTIETS